MELLNFVAHYKTADVPRKVCEKRCTLWSKERKLCRLEEVMAAGMCSGHKHGPDRCVHSPATIQRMKGEV